MNKKVLIPVITIPAVSLIAVAIYLVKKAKISRKELEDELINIEIEDLK